MKSFIILTLFSLAVAASATPAGLVKIMMNRGRRLSSESVTKLTCVPNVKGVIAGKCGSSDASGDLVAVVDKCINGDGNNMIFSYTGTTITRTDHATADCSDTGTPYSYVSGACDSNNDYYKVYEGTGVQWEEGEKCSSVTTELGANLYVADNKCLALATDSKKGVCSSDGKITFSEYSDTNCSTLNNTETHTSGECFPASASPDASPAARAVPFVFVLLSVILASMLMQ